MDAIPTPLQFIHANMKRLYLLTGLDPTNDRFHADISNSFIQNNDPSSKYELLTAQYEQFEPTDKIDLRPNVGILRVNWIEKYTQRRPAVILIFVDLEWDDPNFNEKKTECESKIHSLKQTIKCQEVRYLLVLIQRRESSTHQTERATELCTACGLVRTQLVPLNVSEGVKPHVIGAIKRSVSDFSQQFYQAIHKKIRTRRVPENHINLMIRNQFKLGYISELRNDLASAMSFYKLAFDKYSEAKIPDEDKYEYLTVASIINYKICEIYFSRGNAIDAVTQFNRHEDKFMNKNKFKPGRYPSEILADIEHAKWCMREYATFGHIFVEAANAVVLNTSVNPGKYFYSAGEFSEIANKLIEQLKDYYAGEFSEIANNLIEQLKDFYGAEHQQVTADILQPAAPLIFLGQRPWRSNVFLADPSIEHRARIALERYTSVNYEQSSIHFKRAIIHFKKIERCSRQMRVAELQLAKVLLKERNFEGALNVAERVFIMMREKNELISRWHQTLMQSFRVDLTQFKTLFVAEGYIHIDSEVCSNEAEAECEARIQNKFLDSIGFTAASFIFHIFSPSVTPQIDSFSVPSNEFLAFNFPLKQIPADFHGGCEVTFSFIELKIGNFVTFVFDNRHHNFNRFSNIIHQTARESIRVIHSEYPLELKHENIQTILKGDICLLKFSIKNNGNFTFSDITVIHSEYPLELIHENIQTILKGDICLLKFSIKNNGNFTFSDITLKTKSIVGENRTPVFSATMFTKESSSFKKRFPLTFDVQEPFTAKINVLNVEGNAVDYLFEGHRGQIEAQLKVQCDCIITGYEFHVEIENSNNPTTEILNRQVCAGDSYVLNTIVLSKTFSSLTSINLGTLSVFWKRKDTSNEVATTFNLGKANVIKSPIAISAELGERNHIIHKEIHVQISLTNLQKDPITFKMTIHRSDVFMFAGTNEIPISLEPGQTQYRTLSFVANVAGELRFPRISIECNNELDSVINSYAVKALPKAVLVLVSYFYL
uniref:Trafficking protein particle complex subunit 11 n=1 Tax=Panagrolaimus sp. PS1159 TaxID=55785 RepID=A0AC35FYW7_9BILA